MTNRWMWAGFFGILGLTLSLQASADMEIRVARATAQDEWVGHISGGPVQSVPTSHFISVEFRICNETESLVSPCLSLGETKIIEVVSSEPFVNGNASNQDFSVLVQDENIEKRLRSGEMPIEARVIEHGALHSYEAAAKQFFVPAANSPDAMGVQISGGDDPSFCPFGRADLETGFGTISTKLSCEFSVFVTINSKLAP